MQPTIEILDEVNVQLKGVNSESIKEAQELLTYWVKGYRFMPTYKAGRWDGKIRLLTGRGRTYLNLLPEILHVFEDRGYDFEIVDYRKDYSWALEDISNRGFPEVDYFSDHMIGGKPVILRDYQLDAIHSAINEGSGILEMATGAGKTITTGVIADYYSKYGNSVVVVPNIDLAVQTRHVYNQMGMNAGLWYMDVKERGVVTVSTWQSLDNYPELFSDVVNVIIDECHEATAKTLSDILAGPGANVPFRFGCTGSMPKDSLDKQQLRGLIGEVITTIKTRQLQDMGVLAETEIYQIRLRDTKNPVFQELPVYYKNEEDRKKSRNGFRFYEWKDQIDWFITQKNRMAKIADIVLDMTKEYGNTLILVEHRETARIFNEAIPGSYALDGRDKPSFRREVYNIFNEGDNGVLICTSKIASTGLDIPRIFNLVFFEPGKSFRKTVQSLGRGLRKPSDKELVRLFDISGDCEFSVKHASERLATYADAEQDYEIIEVEYHHVDA